MNRNLGGWIVGSVLLVVLLYATIGAERYCFYYPSIDTHYAAGFSEPAFAKVKVGMTRTEVLDLIGPPLDGLNGRAGERWQYTRDGKCSWADWAWMGREVIFQGDQVSEKNSRIWYD